MAALRAQRVSQADATNQMEQWMEQIRSIHFVDGEKARAMLEGEGISEAKRAELERQYIELKRAAGQSHGYASSYGRSGRGNQQSGRGNQQSGCLNLGCC